MLVSKPSSLVNSTCGGGVGLRPPIVTYSEANVGSASQSMTRRYRMPCGPDPTGALVRFRIVTLAWKRYGVKNAGSIGVHWCVVSRTGLKPSVKRTTDVG